MRSKSRFRPQIFTFLSKSLFSPSQDLYIDPAGASALNALQVSCRKSGIHQASVPGKRQAALEPDPEGMRSRWREEECLKRLMPLWWRVRQPMTQRPRRESEGRRRNALPVKDVQGRSLPFAGHPPPPAPASAKGRKKNKPRGVGSIVT